MSDQPGCSPPEATLTDRAVHLPAGAPSPHEVLDVVRAALHDEVVPVTTDRPQYVVRMACRLLEIIQRELDDGPDHAHELQDRLRETGATDESDLASGLMAGRFDPTDVSIRALIHELVRWRIAIARPDALGTADAHEGDPADHRRRTTSSGPDQQQQGVTP